MIKTAKAKSKGSVSAGEELGLKLLKSVKEMKGREKGSCCEGHTQSGGSGTTQNRPLAGAVRESPTHIRANSTGMGAGSAATVRRSPGAHSNSESSS
jgi:hypothetical protein